MTVVNVICTTEAQVGAVIDWLDPPQRDVDLMWGEFNLHSGPCVVCYEDTDNSDADLYNPDVTMTELIKKLRRVWGDEIRYTYAKWRHEVGYD